MLGVNQRKLLYSMSTGIYDARGLRLVSVVGNGAGVVISSLLKRKYIKEIRLGHFVFYKRTSSGRAALHRWENKNG